MHPDFGAPGCAAGTAVTPFSPCFRSCSHPPAVSAGKLCKTKSSTHFHTLNFFGGRGWITQAAHLKKPRRGFFPAGLFGGSMLFSSTLVVRYKVQIKQKLQRHNNAGVLGGRGWITQAAHLKKPRRGFFPRRTIRRVDAVRIHPLGEINFAI